MKPPSLCLPELTSQDGRVQVEQVKSSQAKGMRRVRVKEFLCDLMHVRLIPSILKWACCQIPHVCPLEQTQDNDAKSELSTLLLSAIDQGQTKEFVDGVIYYWTILFSLFTFFFSPNIPPLRKRFCDIDLWGFRYHDADTIDMFKWDHLLQSVNLRMALYNQDLNHSGRIAPG